MMRRWWAAIALWCEEMVFALCCACDGEEPSDDEIVDERPDPAPVVARDVPDVASAIAGAVRYHDQQYERLQAARRRWALIVAGAEQGDEAAAAKDVAYLDRLYRASCIGIGEALEGALVREAR